MSEIIDESIEEGHGGCVCGICDSAVTEFESHTVVIAHGCKYIVHKECFDNLADDEGGES